MAQQMVNGSHYKGSVTVTNRTSDRYAVVGNPNNGKHHLNPNSSTVKKEIKECEEFEYEGEMQ